jgi:hypothetical protein
MTDAAIIDEPAAVIDDDVAELANLLIDPEAQAPAEEPAVPAPGSLRARILDHLVDTADDGPQSVAQIIAGVGNCSRNTAEQALRRMRESGEIVRTSPGHYVIAPPRPKAEPPKPAPPPEPKPVPDPDRARIEAALARDCERKQDARRRDREAALARRAEADRVLRDQLLEATGGNFMPGPALDHLRCIRAAMELVPLDCILGAIRNKTDRVLCPVNEPLARWDEPRILKAIAERYTRFILTPRLVAEWRRAQPQKPVSAWDVAAAVEVPADPESASTVPPQSDAISGDELGERDQAAIAVDMRGLQSMVRQMTNCHPKRPGKATALVGPVNDRAGEIDEKPLATRR